MSSFKRPAIFVLTVFGIAIAGAFFVQNHVTLSPAVARHAVIEDCFLKKFKRDAASKAMAQDKLTRICAATVADYQKKLRIDGMSKDQISRSTETVEYGSYNKTLKIIRPCPNKKTPKKKEKYQVS